MLLNKLKEINPKSFAKLVLLSLVLAILSTSFSNKDEYKPTQMELIRYRANSISQSITSMWLSHYGITRQEKEGRKIVALTFDDGPDNLYTPQILDILKKYQVKATFFLVGNKAEENPAILKRILSEGHAIGNHSYSHIDLGDSDLKVAQADITQGQQALEKLSGQKITLFRPPYSSTNKKITKLAEDLGMQTIMWSVAPYDYKGWDSKTIEMFTISRVKNGSIVLEHSAGNQAIAQTVASLPAILVYLQKQGYSTVTIPEMLQ